MDQAFGGSDGHSFDLMALDSNAPMGRNGIPLPHFTPFRSPCSAGVNLFCQDLRSVSQMSNPYVFPPFGLIGPKFLYGFKIPFTVIIFFGGRNLWLVVPTSCASASRGTWMSFSPPQGLVIDRLHVRLLCGHAGYLVSRLCQALWTSVIFSTFRFLADFA